jgi:hypothetical protein
MRHSFGVSPQSRIIYRDATVCLMHHHAFGECTNAVFREDVMRPEKYYLLFIYSLIGMAIALYQVVNRWDDMRATYFSDPLTRQMTTGQIVASTYHSVSGRTGTSFIPDIAYTYQVNGVEYRSTKITFEHRDFSSSAHVESFIQYYPVGRSVPVYYDPTDPQLASLERFSKGDFVPIVIIFVVSLFFFVISGAAVIALQRTQKR